MDFRPDIHAQTQTMPTMRCNRATQITNQYSSVNDDAEKNHNRSMDVVSSDDEIDEDEEDVESTEAMNSIHGAFQLNSIEELERFLEVLGVSLSFNLKTQIAEEPAVSDPLEKNKEEIDVNDDAWLKNSLERWKVIL